MGAAVRVVFEPLHLGRYAVLVPAEVDDAVVLLVGAAAMPHRDVAEVVAPGTALLDSVSAETGLPLCRDGFTTLTIARRPGEVGFSFTTGI